jgi:sodium-dependent phosphate transporter
LAVFVGVSALSFTVFPTQGGALMAGAKALGLGLLGAIIINVVIRQQLGSLLGAYCELPVDEEYENAAKHPIGLMSKVEGPKGTQLKIVYSVFGYLQVLSACFMSFAHGANDVANAIGPISAALAILHRTGLTTGGSPGMPVDVLAWGGFGIVAGLLVWGYRVIATIGNKITELTPTRGFAAEFAAATVVVMASRLGLPISATHTLVGAVMGVGFARGLNSVRGDVVREIVASWMVTIPVGALLSVIYTAIFTRLIPSLA